MFVRTSASLICHKVTSSTPLNMRTSRFAVNFLPDDSLYATAYCTLLYFKSVPGVLTVVMAGDVPGENTFVVNAGPYPDPVS